MQRIQYFAPKYLWVPGGVYLSSFKKYLLHVQCIQYFAPKYLVVHLSSYKKYFLHVQSIQYFPPKYLATSIQLQKNTSCTCKVFNILHLNT